MKFGLSIIAATVIAGSLSGPASAQNAVPPRWNYQGSAVCPDGFDYYANRGLCISRGYGGGYYGGGGGYGGDGVPARWNRAGSAVCPQGYDYHAHSGLCRPQRY
jgi:hypothetical protein